MMAANEIRDSFKKYFESKQHAIVPSAPIMNVTGTAKSRENGKAERDALKQDKGPGYSNAVQWY